MAVGIEMCFSGILMSDVFKKRGSFSGLVCLGRVIKLIFSANVFFTFKSL